MPKYRYCVPCRNEVGEYTETEGITDFNRGTFLAFKDCCLTTGFKTKEEAEKWMKEHPCKSTELTGSSEKRRKGK